MKKEGAFHAFQPGPARLQFGSKISYWGAEGFMLFFGASWRTRGDASLKSVHIFMGLFILFQLFSFVSRCCSLLLFLFVVLLGLAL